VLFDAPNGLERASQFLFASVSITTMTALLSSNFGAASLITHRFALRNIVRSLTSLSRVGVVILCFMLWPASLWHVGIGFMLSACVGLIGDMLVARRLMPQLRIAPREIDSTQFRALMGLSGWSAVNQVGILLLTGVDLLIVNTLFGSDATGRYGALLLLPALVNMALETIVTVLSPAIMARYAVGDATGVKQLATVSVKLLGVGLALPTGLLCGLAHPLLQLWLGPDFGQLDILLMLLVGHLSMNLAIRPVAFVITAYNRVRVQAILTVALAIGNICLAIALARYSGWGMCGVAAAAAIVWTIKNAVFMTSYGSFVMHLPWWTFYRPVIAGALGTVTVALVGRFTSELFVPHNLIALGSIAAAISGMYGVSAYSFLLNRRDRDLLWSLLQRRPHA
jgi:membrane protein EpsK